jgi:hypothetical protein
MRYTIAAIDFIFLICVYGISFSEDNDFGRILLFTFVMGLTLLNIYLLVSPQKLPERND